eukprot:gene7344-13076_t
MLCDGDSKAFSAVKELAPYGPDVEIGKEDCINHVSKRMGSALRNLVAESKAQKQPVSGKGKLTQEKMLKIQNYYGWAIKNHAGDIPLLEKSIMAILLYLSSTDDLPKHVPCPPGSSSWCFWQRALAKKETPGISAKRRKKDKRFVLYGLPEELFQEEVVYLQASRQLSKHTL